MPRRSKYGNVRTTFMGLSFDSKMEADYARQLEFMRIGKLIKSWEKGRRMPVAESSDGKKIVYYVPDMVVTKLDGTQECYDVKGCVTALFRLKALLFTIRYPDIPLKTVDKRGKVTVW